MYYLLVFLSSSNFPFEIYDIPFAANVEQLLKLKRSLSVQQISQLTNTPWLTQFGELIFNLDFKEEPNYSQLIFVLQKNLMDMDLNPGETDINLSDAKEFKLFPSLGDESSTQCNISKESIESLQTDEQVTSISIPLHFRAEKNVLFWMKDSQFHNFVNLIKIY